MSELESRARNLPVRRVWGSDGVSGKFLRGVDQILLHFRAKDCLNI